MSLLAHNAIHRDDRSLAGSTATHRQRIVRVLVAHDNQGEVELLLQELKRARFIVSANVAHTPEEFSTWLRSSPYDVVLANNSMSAWTGMQVLEHLRKHDEEMPFIVLANNLEENVTAEFIKKGASDCVDRNHLTRLPIAVAIAVEQKSMREDQNRVEKELRRSEAHYRALVENPSYGICRFDVDGRFLDVNEALVRMLGYVSRQELMAVNLATEIIRDPTERAQLFGPYRRTGHIDSIEIEWKRKDGSPMRVRLSGRRVGSEQGSPDGCQVIAEDVTLQRASDDRLRHLAATDALTGLANYRTLAETLESEITRSERTGRPFAVLVFDLDGMKQINDGCGHLTGNRALCRLADVFRLCCRSMDTAARYGGDEFAIVLPETGATNAGLVGKRICELLANDHEKPALSVSVGVGIYPEGGQTIETLLQTADRALYKMKRL